MFYHQLIDHRVDEKVQELIDGMRFYIGDDYGVSRGIMANRPAFFAKQSNIMGIP
jgi:hypothetical protein